MNEAEVITAADIIAVSIKGIITGWKVANPLNIHSGVIEVVGLDEVYRLLDAIEQTADTALESTP